MIGTTQGFLVTRLVALCVVLAGACAAPVLRAQESPDMSANFIQTVDMVSAIVEDDTGEIIFSGKSGVVGILSSAGADMVARISRTDVKDDFLVIEKVANGGVLLGSSKGDIYTYQKGSVKKVASLSEFSEPILDIDSQGGLIWAGGGRGLLATSADEGRNWSPVEIDAVSQPALSLSSREPGVWYLGVSNIDVESVVFNAQVKGRPAVMGEDFAIEPDEGLLTVLQPLDQEGEASIAFDFHPGPPYRGGDVTWSVVVAGDEVVTLAGEFGLILQSMDGGKNWSRRNGVITRDEPSQPYWLSGAARNGEIILGGAAGKVLLSKDNGVTWAALPIESQEGVFGVDFIADGTPVIAGAVGLLGIYRDGDWYMADRTALDMRSWVKNLVNTGGGVWFALGGRSTALSLVDDGWKKLDVAVSIEASK